MNCNTPPISSRTPLYFDISCLRRLHQPAFLPGTHYRQGFVLYSTTLLTAFHRSTSSVATERCLPCHSMLRDGRHLQSCCSTLVSTVYTQQHSSLVSTATSLLGQPPSLCHAYSLAAPVWPSSLWWHEIVAHAVSLPSSCYPRLGSRHKWHCHRLHRAFATLPRTRLITPFHRRGNHFKHFVCQGCNGRLFSGCLFALSSRGQSDPAFGTPGEDHQHQDSRDRSGPRFHATGDVRQSPKPLDFLRVFLILNLSL